MLSIEEFISYLAQGKKRSELATWRASRPAKIPRDSLLFQYLGQKGYARWRLVRRGSR